MHQLLGAALIALLPGAAHARGFNTSATVVALVLVFALMPLLLSTLNSAILACAAVSCLLAGVALLAFSDQGVLSFALVAIGAALAAACFLFRKRQPPSS